ncbi:MAG: hypothetical protein IJR98_02035, partial [Synergistaceae bacterium]|nr:hypothetical protein [Synergistaceae bacterium]
MRVRTGLWSLDKGAGMTELGLIDALVAYLKSIFEDYQLPAKSGLLQNVRVFAQYMPQPEAVEVDTGDEVEDTEAAIAGEGESLVDENGAEETAEESPTEPLGYSASDIESNFPCVIVKFEESIIREEKTIDAVRINVTMLVGTYDESPDCQGYRDVMNIMDKVKLGILTLPSRILAQRYRLEMPLKDSLPPEQPFPIYLGVIETVWETGRPLMPNHPRCEIRY